MSDNWVGLRDLLKDCCLLNPPASFLGLSILHQFATGGAITHMEKKEIKEIQEMASKLVETISIVAGSRLEAGTWLRGNRTVKLEEEGKSNESSAIPALKILSKFLAILLDKFGSFNALYI